MAENRPQKFRKSIFEVEKSNFLFDSINVSGIYCNLSNTSKRIIKNKYRNIKIEISKINMYQFNSPSSEYEPGFSVIYSQENQFRYGPIHHLSFMHLIFFSLEPVKTTLNLWIEIIPIISIRWTLQFAKVYFWFSSVYSMFFKKKFWGNTKILPKRDHILLEKISFSSISDHVAILTCRMIMQIIPIDFLDVFTYV